MNEQRIHYYQIEYYIGKLDKDTKKQELSDETFIKTISDIIGGCTITRIEDIYNHTLDPSLLVIRLETGDYDDIDRLAIDNCRKLNKIFNQECILYKIQDTKANFVYGMV